MGYTVSLTSGATSQNEGNPGGTAASWTFTLNRQAGDASVATNYSFTIYNASTFAVADDFATNTGAITGWSGGGNVGVLQTTLTITANLDTTIESNESFFVYFTIDGVTNPFAQYSGLTLVNDDAGPPVFSSSATFNAAENQTAVGTAIASGSGVTYTLQGGADAAFFTVSAAGVITFQAAPNFEVAADAGANNVYDIIVRATAGGLTTDQAIAVTVTNVFDVAPVITSGAAPNVAENTKAVLTLTATDAETGSGDVVTWSIVGGADASKFAVNSSTGELTFVTAPNFESATDVGANNVYDVNVRATDKGGNTTDQAIAVTVTDVAEAPVITSNGGGDLALIHVNENTTSTITTVVATDSDGDAVTYSISGGADAARFSITAGGVLTFVASPNFEAPLDANADNLYEVQVQASSAGPLTDTQSLYIFVDNVIEDGVPTDVPTVPGTPVTPPTPPTNAGNDNFIGTGAGEYIAGGTGDDTIDGGAGDDWLDGDDGNDVVFGGDGNDFVRGLNGDDYIDGGAGADDVNGNLGSDTVHGGDGNDTVRGGQGNDSVYGDGGDDGHVNGNIGDDHVFGGDGNDTCYGGQDNDTVDGGNGDDYLSGDLGNDVLIGGNGADRFAFRVGSGHDWIADFSFAQGDRLVLAPGTAYTVGSYQGQLTITLGANDIIGFAGVSSAGFTADWIVFA